MTFHSSLFCFCRAKSSPPFTAVRQIWLAGKYSTTMMGAQLAALYTVIKLLPRRLDRAQRQQFPFCSRDFQIAGIFLTFHP